jgi:hypothetical protein
MKSRRGRQLAMFMVLLSLLCAGVVAQEVGISSVSNVKMNTTANLDLTIQHSSKDLGTVDITLKYDPSVMKITRFNLNSDLWTSFGGEVQPGIIGIAIYGSDGFSATPVNAQSPVSIGSFVVESMLNDGSQTPLELVLTTVTDYDGSKITSEFTDGVKGFFSTLDEVPPTITIDYPHDTATVSQDIMVNATITDVSGIDPTSIKVYVDDNSIDTFDKKEISQGYTINATYTAEALGPCEIRVEASDESIKPNKKSTSINVNVRQSGITITCPTTEGQFINTACPEISADFVNVNAVRMFLDGKDVTGNCTIDGGTITLGYDADCLDNKEYEVVVSGTDSITQLPISSDRRFVIDTIPPIITITKVVDSDGDGFPEAGEGLDIHYIVDDANFKKVWFGNGCNTTYPSGIIRADVTIGNLEMVAYAEDLAGNIKASAPVHIYNNNLVYFDDPSLGSFAGLDLTKTALYDVFATAKAFTLIGPDKWMTSPKIGEIKKAIIPGSNVKLDYCRDKPIPAGSLPDKVGIYTTPTGTLDFSVKVPNVTNATLMIARANSTLIDQLVQNPSRDALTPGMLEDLLDSKKMVFYGKEGYAIVNVAGNSFDSKGSITVTPSNLPQTIRDNYVDLNAEFDTKAALAGIDPLPISKLGQGEYALLAICMDGDHLAIIAATAFTVTEKADILSTSAKTYTIGNPVVVNSKQKGDVLSAVMINSVATYTGNVTLDFTTLGRDTFKSAYLLANSNQTVVKPYSKANLWLTKGYGNASAKKNAASVSVPTFDLLPGTYRVYMFLEDNGNVTSYDEAIITLTATTPTPTPTPPTYTPSRGGGGSGPTYTSYTGTGTLTVNNVGTVLRSIKVNADDKVGSLLVPIGVKALDKDGNPLTSITLTPLASDKMPAVPSGALFKFAGYVYEAGPDGATFEPGITLAFDLPADAWNALDPDNNDFKVKWYNEETEEWEDVPTTTYKSTRSVDAEITHFSIFALFTEPVTTPTETPTPPVDIDIPTTPPVDEKPPAGEFPTTIFAIVVVLVIVIAAGYFFIVRK